MNKYKNLFATAALTALIAGAYSAPSFSQDSDQTIMADGQEVFKDLEDRFSYAYGFDLAKKFKAQGIVLNVDLLAEAMQAAFTDGEVRMPEGEVAQTLALYKEVHAKRIEEKRAIDGEKNKKDGDAYLAENAKKDGVIITESGLQYKVITPGTGDYHPQRNDEVIVHYRATFVDGSEFDSTYSRGEPFSVKVKQLIDGWSEALQLMTKGAKWQLVIPSEIAYGERGSGDYVGPHATLIFEVELLDIEKKEQKKQG